MSPKPTSPEDPARAERVYHVELRQFPHNLCRFNLTERELRATVLGPWVREPWLELGERKWKPDQAKLTVLEGPRLGLDQLSMGRGWRAAQREGRDVTAQMLAGSQPEPRPRQADLLADSLGLELLADIGAEAAPLRRAWELAAARPPGALASEALAVAERAVVSLLRAKLIVLLRAGAPASAPAPVNEEEAEEVLGALESWTGEGKDVEVWVRRV